LRWSAPAPRAATPPHRRANREMRVASCPTPGSGEGIVIDKNEHFGRGLEWTSGTGHCAARPMFQMGQTRHSEVARLLPVYPDERTSSDRPGMSGLCQQATLSPARYASYSITSSARSKKASGIIMPSAFAVVRLTTSSKVVGCSTGRSAGFAPFKILSTRSAARRNRSIFLAP
jgi:hypothetical protein